MKAANYGDVLLRGFGQVMFQNSPITGLLFLAGIFVNSWVMGLGALLGALSGTLAAVLLKYPKKEISDGLYGFNGVLVGIGLLFFFELNATVLALVVLGSVLSTIVMRFMLGKKLPPFTFPFVIVTWILILAVSYAGLAGWVVQGTGNNSGLDIISAVSMGAGQVMFQGNVLTGALFFIGILVNSRTAALYALLGSAMGVVIGVSFSLPLDMMNLGILGYNGVLCGIAFAGKKVSSFAYAMLSILLAALLLYGFQCAGFIALTAPFVFATWITLMAKRFLAGK